MGRNTAFRVLWCTCGALSDSARVSSTFSIRAKRFPSLRVGVTPNTTGTPQAPRLEIHMGILPRTPHKHPLTWDTAGTRSRPAPPPWGCPGARIWTAPPAQRFAGRTPPGRLLGWNSGGLSPPGGAG